ncbi:Short chain dehydrogenase/reductase [Pleurostoma richardsiae]|uniref:Short chain dehydrogenase/reductase n=1 Tax=Pleurostoma richardsiae TaxID=41990 RepID=A0AA38VHN4_9PEZI|nr:Short chain dehydrogenase/reductase [Pleurostoma richardsiae]
MSSKIILITGANAGVGYATTQVLASAGYHVIMASRSLEKAEISKLEIQSAGAPSGSLDTLQLDVTDEESIKRAASVVAEKFGRLDVLVNNAAISNEDPDVGTRFRLSFATNVVGPALVSAAFRPLLQSSPGAYSIYVSSSVGSLTMASDPTLPLYQKMPNLDAYRASKAALNMIAVREHAMHGGAGLKVFAMCPGFVRSNVRGTSEEARSGWGMAGDPRESGELVLSIVEGKRDADVGRFVWKDGVYPW